jgi:hypothetical protein
MERTHAIRQSTGGAYSTRAGNSTSTNFAASRTHPVLKLQRSIGNRAVQRLFQSDLEEQNRQDGFRSGGTQGDVINEVLNAPGEALDQTVRALMESSFGTDFSGVRVHTDSAAAESAHGIHAHAYTSGPDIVFSEGRYAPGTAEGQRLLAHELAHVVQQAAGPVPGISSPDRSLSISDPTDTFEQAADAHADRVMAGAPQPAATDGAAETAGQTSVQCQDESEDLVDQAMGSSSEMKGAATAAGGDMDSGGNLGFPGLGSNPWLMGLTGPVNAALGAGQSGISAASALAQQVPGLGGVATGVGNVAGQASDWLRNLF